MKNLIHLAVLVATCTTSTAYACDHVEWGTTLNNGTHLSLNILEADVRSTASWNPEREEPPLALTSAYTIAMSWARPHYSDYEDVRVSRVSLARFGCLGEPPTDYWYYVFDLKLFRDGREIREIHWVAVLMDRRVITEGEG